MKQIPSFCKQMKRNDTVVNLQKPISRHRFGSTNTKTNKEVDKFFASKNNVQYNVSVEYSSKERTSIKSLSFGTALKEMPINNTNTSTSTNMVKVKSSRLKDSNTKLCGFCVYYNILNIKKLEMDMKDTDSDHKVTLVKNRKTFYYGVSDISTTKINLRVAKAAEIFLLFDNLLKQHKDNELNIASGKMFPDVLAAAIKERAKIKEAFIKVVVNMVKRYY